MATEEPIVPTPLGAEEAEAPAATAEENPPAETDVKETKKAPAPRKPRNPPYFEMIKDAIVTLKEKTGSSQYAIAKFIEEKHNNLHANFKKTLSTQLKEICCRRCCSWR